MTIFGQHSVNEVVELVSHWDAVTDQLLEQVIGFMPQWLVKDPTAANDFQKDWTAFYGRYSRMRSGMNDYLKLHPLARDITPAEAQYTQVLKALTADYPGPWKKGDYDDLINRLSTAGKQVAFTGNDALGNAVSGGVVSHPAADVDLNAYKEADTAVKATQKTAVSGGKALAIGAGVAVGVVAAKKIFWDK